jgi:hypothetical protein
VKLLAFVALFETQGILLGTINCAAQAKAKQLNVASSQQLTHRE